MRPIDGHELYRQIPLKVCLPCPFGEEKECKDCVIDEVMKVIGETPTVAASPWHRVGDELPEIEKRVLVFAYGWTQIMTRRDDGDKLCEKYWENEDGLWERVEADSYWMPLPEPPKEDE